MSTNPYDGDHVGFFVLVNHGENWTGTAPKSLRGTLRGDGPSNIKR